MLNFFSVKKVPLMAHLEQSTRSQKLGHTGVKTSGHRLFFFGGGLGGRGETCSAVIEINTENYFGLWKVLEQ